MVLIVPDTYLVAIKARSGAQDVVNVIGVRKAFSGADLATQAVLNALKVANGPMTRHVNTYQLASIDAMFLGQADGETHSRPDTSLGARAVTKSTNAACALISIGANSRARTSKGRLYFGPLPESDINDDGRSMVTASQTALVTAWTAFQTSLTAAGFEWVVISRKLQTATAITQISCQSVIATQRRRIR